MKRIGLKFIFLAMFFISIGQEYSPLQALTFSLEDILTVPRSVISNEVITVAWQQIGSDHFLAVGGNLIEEYGSGDSDLRLFQFSPYGAPGLEQVFEVPDIEGVVRSVSWVLVGGTYYLAVGGVFDHPYSGKSLLSLYEFVAAPTPHFEFVSTVDLSVLDSPTMSVNTVDWQEIGGEFFLAVGGTDLSGTSTSLIRLFKLDTSGTPFLMEVDPVGFTPGAGNTVNSVSWQEVDGSFFLAAAGSSFGTPATSVGLRLYQFFDYGSPILVEIDVIDTSIPGLFGEVNWQEINGQFYLGAGGTFTAPLFHFGRLYKLDGFPGSPVFSLEQVVSDGAITGGKFATAQWVTVCSEKFISFGGGAPTGGLILLYHFDSSYGLLTQESVVGGFGNVVGPSGWQPIDGSFFLAAGTDSLFVAADENLRLLQFTASSNLLDLIISKTVDSVMPSEGDTVTFTVTVTNGVDCMIADNVEVNDLLPTGLTFVASVPTQGSYNSSTGLWTVGSLGPGNSASMIISATVDSGTAGSTIVNTAVARDVYGFDVYELNNSASVSITVRSADIVVTKAVTNNPALPGSINTYQIMVTNNGPDTAPNVRISDVLPAEVSFVSSIATTGSYLSASGEWIVGNLAVGSTEALYVTVTVGAGLTPGSTVTNTASFGDPYNVDSYFDNNADSVTFTVGTPPFCDLSVVKVSDKTEIDEGESVIFTITVSANQVN